MIRVYRDRLNHGFWHRNSIRALFLVPALVGLSLIQAQASTYPNATALGIWRAALAGPTTRISGSSTGATIATRGNSLPTGNGWMPAGNYGVASGAQGAVKIGGAGTVSVGGKSVPVDISGQLSKDVIAGAVSGCVTGGIVGCAIGAGIPLALAWMTSSGGLRVTSDGKVETLNDGNCGGGRCYEWSAELTANTGWNTSPDDVCKAIAAQASAANGATYTSELRSGEFPRFTCILQGTGDREWHSFAVPTTTRTAASSSGTWYPATPADIRDKLIKAGPPNPMIVPELEKNGVDWNKRWPGFDIGSGTPDGSMGEPTITGPSSIKGDTTTTTNSDGSRTTTTTSTPINYGPGTVSAGPTSSTTTTTNADGSIRTTSTTTTTPGEATPAGQEEKPPTDPCDEHPQRVGCLDIDVPAGEIPKETKNVTFDIKPLPGISDGQCPADVSMAFRTMPSMGASKIIDWRSFCDMALPLRAIVMALAAIMSFFIVMPGGRVE